MRTRWLAGAGLLGAAVALTPAPLLGQAARTTLYLVATAHLDTQWNWTVQDTIRDHIPKTFHTNFALFEKYPNYKFSFEGAIHYMWFKEYHPDEWPKLQQYVKADRWQLAGSWINAVDTNMPSPESLFRQALYAQRFFRQEFGQEPKDVYLPDCFGFGFALPSIAAHSGLIAFSTQKLTWGRAIPFPIGLWKGVDGSEVVAEFNPGSYTTRIGADISLASTNGRPGDTPWLDDPTPVGNGQSLEFRYFGTGDTGGGPTDASVDYVNKAVGAPAPDLVVKNTAPDQLAKDLTPDERARLPVYDDELILKTHGTGCYTSQAAMKRFNRANELLADAAEKAGVSAAYLAGAAYPTSRLREAWIRVLWHQFHDDLTGTCIPQAYQFSWNDELASLNQFAGVLTSSTSAVSALLDTSGAGVPLVVYNPVSAERREPVEAVVHFGGPAPSAVRVVDAATGDTALSQVLGTSGSDAHILFLADVPSVGYKVFHVSAAAASAPSALHITSTSLENNRLAVTIDTDGDIASIYDKDAKHDLLSAPVMLELRDNPSPSWPAWEVLYSTVMSPAREYVANPTVRIVERGPVRVTLEITRKASGSTFVQRVSLTQGGDRVDVVNDVDWRSPDTELKASFPFAASNPKATYDLGLGTIERGNDEPDKYEVPAQKWADIDDTSGTFGVGVINDSKYGWDKPDNNTLRLTLLHTPRPNTSYTYQSSNDLGGHHFVFAIAGHAGDWRQGRLPARAAALNQPLIAFQTTPHPGPVGRAFSMVSLDDPTGQVAVVAFKKAEDSNEFILRLQERYGEPVTRMTVRLPGPITAIREVNAAEEAVGPFELGGRGGRGRQSGGPRLGPSSFPVDLTPYQPRTLAITMMPAWAVAPAVQAAEQAAASAGRGRGRGFGFGPRLDVPQPSAPAAATVDLRFNLDGASTDAQRADGDFDGNGHTIAAELLPAHLDLDGVPFTFGATAPGAKNVLVPTGQMLALPAGSWNRVYLLAAAVGGDVRTTLGVGATSVPLIIREWQGPIGQWWSRLKGIAPALHKPFVPADGRPTPSQQEIQDGLVVRWDPQTGEVSGMDQIHPAFVKRDEIAWIGTHRHDPNGNEPYVASYLFVYGVDLPPGTHALRLPSNPQVRIMAVSVARQSSRVTPAGRLYVGDFPDPRDLAGTR
jgi:alpha-mannosidase